MNNFFVRGFTLFGVIILGIFGGLTSLIAILSRGWNSLIGIIGLIASVILIITGVMLSFSEGELNFGSNVGITTIVSGIIAVLVGVYSFTIPTPQ